MNTSVTFVLAVLNERERLPRLLESIRTQRGFGGRIEIVVADGGSTDGTIAIADSYGCRVIHNSVGRCEPGIALAISHARGDIVIVLAADNPLGDDDFLVSILKPFEDATIAAAFPLVVATQEDPPTVSYLNCFTDPFNHFVYWNCASPLTFKRAYPVLKRTDSHVVYDYRCGDAPLIALAQGFAFRQGLARPEGSEEDDIVPVEALIRSGGLVAFVPAARIEHHTVSGYRQFIAKFEPRIAARLRNRDMAAWQRPDSMSSLRKVRRIVWPFYAISFLGPAGVALYGWWRDRRAEWLMHPFLSFGLAISFWKQLLLYALKRSNGKTVH